MTSEGPRVGITITWPMTILSGSLMVGLTAMICFCVTPYFVAILASVSPGLTV